MIGHTKNRSVTSTQIFSTQIDRVVSRRDVSRLV